MELEEGHGRQRGPIERVLGTAPTHPATIPRPRNAGAHAAWARKRGSVGWSVGEEKGERR